MKTKLAKIHNELLTPKMGDGRIPFHPILMMHAATMYGKTYTEFLTDYNVLVDSNLHLLDMYDHDAVSVISDPYREATAFGAKVDFSGDKFPVIHQLVSSLADVENLKVPDVYACERTLDRIKGVELFRAKLGNPFPIIGWVEGPLAEAADLMGLTEVLMDLMLDPSKIRLLLQKTLMMAKDFALAQIKAGANIIGVGDAICSQISKETYDEFCLPLHRELFDFIHRHGGLVKVHICGNITHILKSLAKLDIDILDIDWMVDMVEAYQTMGDSVMVCGNIDPVAVVLEGTKELMSERFKELKKSIPLENWIFMAGCEIPRDTKPETMIYLRQLSNEMEL